MQVEIKNSGMKGEPGAGETTQLAECLPGIHEATGPILAPDNMGTAAYTRNPSA